MRKVSNTELRQAAKTRRSAFDTVLVERVLLVSLLAADSRRIGNGAVQEKFSGSGRNRSIVMTQTNVKTTRVGPLQADREAFQVASADTMNSPKRTKRIVGASQRRAEILIATLFLVSAVTSFLGLSVLDPILNASDYLARVFPNKGAVELGSLLWSINNIGIVFIAVFAFRLLRKCNEALAGGSGWDVLALPVAAFESILLPFWLLFRGFK